MKHWIMAVLLTATLWMAGCATTADRSTGAVAVGDARVVGDPRRPDAGAMEEAAARQSPVIGHAATDFTLPDQEDRPVSLAAQRGRWVVLYFYPANDTPGCNCQATEFTDLLKQFNDLGARVLGVSPDTTGNHRFFRKKYQINIDLLSDPDKRVMRQYGAWVESRIGDQVVGRVARSTFLIDPSGRIAWHWPEVVPEGHAHRVRAKLVELQGR